MGGGSIWVRISVGFGGWRGRNQWIFVSEADHIKDG